MGHRMTRPKSTPPADSTEATPGRPVKVSGILPLERIFTSREVPLMRDIRALADGGTGPYAADLRRALDSGLQSLATLSHALASYPSLKKRHVLADKTRSEESLIKRFVEGGQHGLEWVLPTKGVLSRTYGIAKVNFFTSLGYVLDAYAEPDAQALRDRLNEAIEEAVYTRLAEELYASFITSRTTDREVKSVAAQQTIEMWEGRTDLVSDRYCPVLRTAWAARTRAPRVFGTLMGTQEIVQLLFQDCDAEFVEYFSRHQADSERRQAFEEFVFDLPFESLERVRQRMREDGKDCVAPREVEKYLGFGEGKLRPLVAGPKDLYVSFRGRRVKAQYRTSMGVPGPKRTAEAYILEAILRETLDRGDVKRPDGS